MCHFKRSQDFHRYKLMVKRPIAMTYLSSFFNTCTRGDVGAVSFSSTVASLMGGNFSSLILVCGRRIILGLAALTVAALSAGEVDSASLPSPHSRDGEGIRCFSERGTFTGTFSTLLSETGRVRKREKEDYALLQLCRNWSFEEVGFGQRRRNAGSKS